MAVPKAAAVLRHVKSVMVRFCPFQTNVETTRSDPTPQASSSCRNLWGCCPVPEHPAAGGGSQRWL
uniref:Uncharacterized protein n=1 Tax=Chelonoidis abingdonii TaxID=106734 RepID=A0A8C0HBQ4_CHEAB